MRFGLTEPCAQCPFPRASCPRWTGPWKPAELLQAIRERPFPCHPTISHDNQRTEDDTLQSCAGAAICLNNNKEPCYTGCTRHPQERLHAAPERSAKASSTPSGIPGAPQRTATAAPPGADKPLPPVSPVELQTEKFTTFRFGYGVLKSEHGTPLRAHADHPTTDHTSGGKRRPAPCARGSPCLAEATGDWCSTCMRARASGP